jgi:hypothetical protein
MKHLSEEQLTLQYFGDGDRASAQHLNGCAECTSRFNDLKDLLDGVRAPEVPGRGAEYGTEVWNRIRAHLPEREAKRPWWSMTPRWAVAGAMAALLVAAFFLGRVTRTPQLPVANNAPSTQGPVKPVSAEELRQRVLLVAVADHLDRSQMLLVELSHASGEGKVDISSERKRAEELAQSNRLYRQTAQQVGDKDVAQVLDQLERVLLDIGHQPPEVTDAELKQVQQQIEAQGILFNVRVIRSKVRSEIAPTKPETGSKGQSTL